MFPRRFFLVFFLQPDTQKEPVCFYHPAGNIFGL